jgi:hypothetical protein
MIPKFAIPLLAVAMFYAWSLMPGTTLLEKSEYTSEMQWYLLLDLL